jgi:diguanylate cyclase (GGDEF)-like protein/PAS domain S-box-containing protein
MESNMEALSFQRFSKISYKPVYHIIVIATAIALTEAAVMIILSFLPQLLLHQRVILDVTALTIVTVPLLYVILLKPYIIERKCVKDSLMESENKYRSLVESTEDSIYMVNKDYQYLFINRRHLKRMGFSGDDYKGRSYGDLHSPGETESFKYCVDTVFRTGESLRREHKSLRDGRYFLRTLSPVRGSQGNVTAVTVVSKEISELKAMEDQLQLMTMSDELTGLYNRRGFFELVEHQLKKARRKKQELFMLYADVDNLKVINDTFGHTEGDKLIVEAAHILKTTYRESDIIARIGGDEFVVFPIIIDSDDVETVITRLKERIEKHNNMIQRGYRFSMSVGISSYDPESGQSVDELLAQADTLMYEHKKAKREALI